MVLGLCGRAGAGKDTCADILCEAFSFYRLAFADAVRAEIVHSFGVDPAIFSREDKEQKTIGLAIGRCADADFIRLMSSRGENISAARTPREIMRWWGTEYRRAQNPAYWLDRAAEKINDAMRRGFRRIIVTDVRFTNEADLIRHYDGDVWMIQRNSADAARADHQSETEVGLIHTDATIENNDSIVRLASLSVRTLIDRTDERSRQGE
ncbi:hypothetical protein EV686_106180 [Paracandidimonas soli]|uniref:Dephospho-CoA kinase n=2 Tax=Paracandidimonas soli TaxID=1917182 RepID=A0A4R3V2B2_9BURK|nr:hypothetical protein EV686_106180 [Paracandidimonas soli]